MSDENHESHGSTRMYVIAVLTMAVRATRGRKWRHGPRPARSATNRALFPIFCPFTRMPSWNTSTQSPGSTTTCFNRGDTPPA